MGTVTLTTDFGGHYIGIMKAVIRGIYPDVNVSCIASDLDAFDIKGGAFVLRSSYGFFPRGTVHLAVVDPGVGSPRKAIAIKTRNYTFVGPDNGLLSLAARHDGIEAVRELSNTQLHRTSVSPTFHGRDIFAPVAAYLASGGEWEAVGEEAEGFLDLELFMEVGNDGSASCEVIFVDRFGNLTLSVTEGDVELKGELGVVFGGKELPASMVRTYDEGTEGLSLLVGSAGYYEIARRRGSAADTMRAEVGDRLTLVARRRNACDKG